MADIYHKHFGIVLSAVSTEVQELVLNDVIYCLTFLCSFGVFGVEAAKIIL